MAFYLPYQPGESWPENLTIYVPDAYKDKFAAAWKNWKVKGETYTVSFNGDGAPGYMESVEGISGDYVLPESGFTYQSAILDYWALPGRYFSCYGECGVLCQLETCDRDTGARKSGCVYSRMGRMAEQCR